MFLLLNCSEDDTIYLFRITVYLRIYVKPFGIGVPGGFIFELKFFRQNKNRCGYNNGYHIGNL